MSNQPSAAYRQHHEVEEPQVDAKAFRQGWRIRTRLDALLAGARITRGEYQAAVEYREAYARMLHIGSISTVRMNGVSAPRDPHEIRLAISDAVDRVNRTDAALDKDSLELCFGCIILDMPWPALGKRQQLNPQTAQNRTAEAIQDLAAAWTGSRWRPARKRQLRTSTF